MNNDLKKHVVSLLDQGKRLDGRGLLEYRQPISIEPGFTMTAEGSAHVKIGETEVMAGVKVEIGKPYPDKPNEGSIMVGAELLPLSSPDFETGPPGIQAVELARVVDRGIRESGSIDFSSLCIEEGEKVWLLLIDVCSMNDAGNLFDICSLAAMAAIKNFKFPKLNEDGSISYKEPTDKGIELKACPLSVTVCKIGDHLLVDPTTDEEKVIDARLTVASLEDGSLCAMQKGGEGALSADEINKMVEIGIEKAKELRGKLE